MSFAIQFCAKTAKPQRKKICIPDCEYLSRLEFLGFIFTNEDCSTGRTIVQVLYLGEKYTIPNLLADICTEYPLEIANAQFYQMTFMARKYHSLLAT